MTAADQEQALIAVVDDYRARECERLRREAEAKAAALLREAWREARRRVHRAAVRERERATARIRAAQAELDTRRRRHQQRLGWVMLKAAWTPLENALLNRWGAEDTRTHWIQATVERALISMPRGRWMIQHPSDWSGAERAAVDAVLALRGADQAVDFQEDASMRAGLIISSGGTSLDASLAGLLGDTAALEARLLALVSQGGAA